MCKLLPGRSVPLLVLAVVGVMALVSASAAEQRKAISSIVQLQRYEAMRQERVAKLLAIVADDQLAASKRWEDRSRVNEAIKALGELKAVEAAPALIERLDMHVNPTGFIKIGEIPPTENIYPAAKALITMGKPALPFVADGLPQKNRSDLFGRNAWYTIVRIEGSPKKALAYLNGRIELYRRGAPRLEKMVQEHRQ